ncbi:hypothetical protein TraAM80_08862 [Trypanosoma rangeli]|uniref:Uncharacterized protein n=1 Tax=Trypanosoma rangeli TaxID=5698 RepID=A0A422MZD5_TRYRA|nr:uncharacterized protein TraAM80_08862 [Trypanosoma rangeli]RNE98500.1 hypothetical protein TraAM80_08862 [Trypanosoma rangeli]|eukprot:RNE98500.1 hypothetical protein TraAM80_08862 [Trypanosoma rangeli]
MFNLDGVILTLFGYFMLTSLATLSLALVYSWWHVREETEAHVREFQVLPEFWTPRNTAKVVAVCVIGVGQAPLPWVPAEAFHLPHQQCGVELGGLPLHWRGALHEAPQLWCWRRSRGAEVHPDPNHAQCAACRGGDCRRSAPPATTTTSGGRRGRRSGRGQCRLA